MRDKKALAAFVVLVFAAVLMFVPAYVHSQQQEEPPVATAPPPLGVTRTATVVRVIDADSLMLETVTRYRVRLLGVDAPSDSTPEGKAASEYVEGLVEGKQVTAFVPFEDARTFGDLMSFERVLGRIWIDGQELSELLIETGHGQK